mgnify:CR=1 FL=1
MTTQAQQVLWGAMTERHLRNAVLDAAHTFHWRLYTTWTSMHSPAGFPDIVMVRPPRLIFVELKTMKGKVSEAQWAWLHDLAVLPVESGTESYLLRPSDLDWFIERLR